MKECRVCKEIKPRDEFYIQKTKYKDKVYENERLLCKKCENKSGIKSRLKLKFDLTLEQYEKLYHDQAGRCALPSCKNDVETFGKSLAVDHCHKTGKVRGLLCNHCNLALGLFRENYELCLDAAMYLKYHDENTD